MSWEALRLTSKSPTENYAILGPHGVDELIRNARAAVWREYPAETRTYAAVKKRMIEVFDRNLRVWRAIKKPTPESFFANLLPYTADGHMRHALVMTWMMMPRSGGRDFADSGKIVEHLFNRMLAAWDEDEVIFTKGFTKRAKPAAKAKSKKAPARKAAAKKKKK